MRTILTKSIVAATLFFGKIQISDAQFSQPKYEVGAMVGTFIYQGDLTPQRFGSFKTPGWNANFFINRLFGNSFSLRTNLVLGKLKGDDAAYSFPEYRKQRAFRFHSTVIEFSELGVWNILGKNFERNISTAEKSRGSLSPYLMAGGGLTVLNIKRDWSRLNVEYFDPTNPLFAGLALDSAHALPKLLPVISIGGGLRYSLSQQLFLSAEMVYRFPGTDYLDGFSKSVNPEKGDHYYSISIGVVYRFGIKNTLNCPPVTK